MRFILLLSMLFVAPLYAYAEDAATPQPIKSPDILSYLERIIGWSRAVTAADQLMDSPREAVLGGKLHQDAQSILQQSFAFARAEAAIAGIEQVAVGAASNSKEDEAQNRRDQLSKAAADSNQRVADLQSQLKQHGLIEAQREKLSGALMLAQARQSLLQTMLGVVSTENNGTLLDQINALSHTVLCRISQPIKILCC